MAMQDGFTLTGYQTEAGNVLEMISLSHKFPEVSVLLLDSFIYILAYHWLILNVSNKSEIFAQLKV